MYRKIFKFFLVTSMSFIGCQKLVEIDSPVTTYDGGKVYKSDASAIAVITSIYQNMSGEGVFQGPNSITSLSGLSADELVNHTTNTLRTGFYQNKVANNSNAMWQDLYPIIYQTNTAIQGVSESGSITPSVRNRLIGEARFLRAFCYFYLVNFWGDIPLILTTDFEKNRLARRASKDQVYQQVVMDLLDAESRLSSNYFLSDLKTVTSERIRPNKWVVKALLSRVYLYMKQYEEAESEATELIDQNQLFEMSTLEGTFLNNSKEAIWRIQTTTAEWNTFEAKTYVLTGAPNFFKPYSLSLDIANSFELGDARRDTWVGSIVANGATIYYSNKYKAHVQNDPQMESLIVFRIAEQYLIRAEARLKLNKIVDCVNDLNIVRARARAEATVVLPNPLPPLLSSTNIAELDEAILNERRSELFCEWGHRWLDLKRTNRIDNVMAISTSKKGGGVWSSYKSLLPVPFDEMQINSNLTQNPGYN